MNWIKELQWDSILVSAITTLIVYSMLEVFKLPKHISNWLFRRKLAIKRRKQYDDETLNNEKQWQIAIGLIKNKYANRVEAKQQELTTRGISSFLGIGNSEIQKIRKEEELELAQINNQFEEKLIRIRDKYLDIARE